MIMFIDAWEEPPCETEFKRKTEEKVGAVWYSTQSWNWDQEHNLRREPWKEDQICALRDWRGMEMSG